MRKRRLRVFVGTVSAALLVLGLALLGTNVLPMPGVKPRPASACPAFPRFPDASCTGWRHTGVTLRDCATTITQPNSTWDRCRFDGGVTILAAHVTITRSLIYGRVSPNSDLRNLMLTDVEIDGGNQADPYNQAAVGNDNYTCIRCDIHNTGRGVSMGSNVRIEDSYLHDWIYVQDAHQTAAGSNGGSRMRLIHNTLICNSAGCSAALSFYGDFSSINDVLVQNNLLNTTGSYCTYAGSVDGKPFPVGTNIRYIDNRFGKLYHPRCGIYGPVAAYEQRAGNVWRGNAWYDGSGEVTA